MIDWLVRKPGAFENYRYREDLFPSSWFRMAYDLLRERLGPRRGAKQYVEMLALAARGGEARVEDAIRLLLNNRAERLNAVVIKVLIESPSLGPLVPAVEVSPVPLAIFDELLSGDEAAA
jgi:hypothetical protein